MSLSSKEEVDMDEAISHSPKKEQGGFLTIVGYPEVGEPCMFVKVFICICFIVFVMLRVYLQIYWSNRCRKRYIQT